MERYTVSMPLLPSALPPKGEASRYGANIFLNLIALPVGGATFDRLRKRFSRFYRFNGFNGFNGFNRFNRFNRGGAAHKNQKRREVYMGRCPNVVFKSTVTSIAFSK